MLLKQTQIISNKLVKTYWANNEKIPKNSIVFAYNSSGTEYTTLYSNNNNKYGTILRWGYVDKYLRILRAHPTNGTYSGWYTEDWEKISAGYADSAGSVAWANITNKPIELGAISGSLASNGWKNLGGRSSGSKIYVSYNNAPAAWNSGTFSSTIAFGANDTKGYVDCAYNTPIISFGGGSVGSSTDDAPTWYFKLSGTSAQTYDLNNLSYIQYDSTLHAIKFIVP